MKVVTDPVLECSLDEFWNEFWSKQRLGITETLEHAIKTFRGEATINPRFRIRTPDGKGDVFFNNRELLCRFAGFPTPTQERIIFAIRQALVKNNVDRMVITVPWSKNGTRRVMVSSSIASTDFDVL